MSCNAFRENKILSKNSEFTVLGRSKASPNERIMSSLYVVKNRIFMGLLVCEYFIYLCTGYINIMSHN